MKERFTSLVSHYSPPCSVSTHTCLILLPLPTTRPTAEDTTADPERHHHSPHKLKVPLPGPRAAEHHTCLAAAAAAAASFFGDTAFAAASSAVGLRAGVRKVVAAVVAAHAAAVPGWAGSSSQPSPAELAVAAEI